MPGILIKPIHTPASSDIDFGAELHNVNVEHLTGISVRSTNGMTRMADSDTDADWEIVRDALYKNQVVVLKNQAGVSPKAQYELTRRFDPEADSYGHGKTLDAKRSVLHPDLKTVPHQPQVQVIGNGFIPEYQGLKNAKLVHPHHKKFHKHPIPEEEDLDFTRFYRWHIDAALYDLDPPRVTSLMAVSVPKGRRQTLRYDDESNETLEVPLGTTAFVSGYRMFDILPDEQKEFVMTSRVEYAPHPYVWMSPARSLSDGLGLYSDGLELPDSELPPIEADKIKIFPMVWQNPVTKKFALQIHPSAVKKIHLKDGTVIDDLAEVRKIVHDLQRPAISPNYVYPHDWEEGDLVLFNNHGVLHSVVGAFKEDEVRLFRQCNMAASTPPVGPS